MTNQPSETLKNNYLIKIFFYLLHYLSIKKVHGRCVDRARIEVEVRIASEDLYVQSYCT